MRGDLSFGTIPRLLRASAERFAALDAIEHEGVRTSFAELASAVERATRALLAVGVEPGDRVGLWAPNGCKWIVAALAAHSTGASLVPVNTRFKAEEAAYVLARSRARVLFAGSAIGVDCFAALGAAETPLPDLRTLVALDGPVPDGSGRVAWDELLGLAERVRPERAEARALAVSPDDSCDVMFTSGTTGHPKGVLSTHAQTLRAFAEWADIVGLRKGDRYLGLLPFFHSFGYKAGWLACLMTGATMLPHAVFDPGVALERIERDRVSVLPGPPSLYQQMLARIDEGAKVDLSSLRLAVTGAAVIPVELVRRMREELRFETVLTGYGLTEATGVSTLTRRGDDAEIIATTSGRAIPGVTVRIVDDAGNELPRGEPGEVVVAGYTVMKGYDGDDEATKQAIDADGWLHTGDVGVMDAAGNLRITDRKKDMFIVGGFNAYPAEIERVLLQHAGIGQAAVVGAPDHRLGEVGVAFVVARPGAHVDEAEVVAWSRERMANYKVPRKVVMVDALPMNATGKVLKYALRERARAL
jgi:acyl-CoA synthetase (AMP-forming)/AMP-acid ligase II